MADALLARALDLPAPIRAAFLRTACGPDRALYRRVTGLLAVATDPNGFLEHPARFLAAPLAMLFEDAADPDLGLEVGGYRIVARVGRGSSGTTFLGVRAARGGRQEAAIKLLRRGVRSGALKDRFYAEVRVLGELRHPHIVQLLGSGVADDGRPYLIMEFVPGLSITRFCDRRRLPLSRRVSLVGDVAGAVHHAHRRGIVHGDVRPDNVLIRRTGDPCLLDFGAAAVAHVSPGTAAWLARLDGAASGFASPERLRGAPASAADDIFQLGALLYLLLTGKRPFTRGQSWRARLAALEHLPPPSVAVAAPSTPPLPRWSMRTARLRRTDPVSLRADLRGRLDRVVMTCLSPAPEQRIGSAEALAQELGRTAGAERRT